MGIRSGAQSQRNEKGISFSLEQEEEEASAQTSLMSLELLLFLFPVLLLVSYSAAGLTWFLVANVSERLLWSAGGREKERDGQHLIPLDNRIEEKGRKPFFLLS